MLKLPDPVFEDVNDERIIVKYISGRILELLKDVLFRSMIDSIEDLNENNRNFLDFISLYFPSSYDKSKMANTFTGLYALLEAEDEFVPELVMEYLMANLIMGKLEEYEDLGLEELIVEPMDEHAYILGKLHEIYDGNEDEFGVSAEEIMNQIENLQEYLEFCFWDSDYALLDEYTEEELRRSPLNEALGIGLKEDENKFIVPPEWRR